ncbi:MAG TPA: sigma-70 family RNA polymerase sigma factor [Phycisphaerae bacterium]|nr:sigma-70 family RNA polymerase sigma factor [Phycisphaerae bacterium]HRW53060.1 sigma-70 family RNA polymerase sigma factor [Phycisphaerae bacterium]
MATASELKDARIPTAQTPTKATLDRFSQADQEILDRLLSRPFEFINDPSFTKRGVAAELFAEDFDAGHDTRPWCNAAPTEEGPATESMLPGQTLSATQERTLFLRLNYARFRIERVLAKFNHRKLTKAAAEEVIWWQQRVEKTQNEIVQANLPLVLAMAKRTKLGNIDYADLISEGNMALLRSVDKFDAGRGYKFSTYACRAILKSFSRVAMKLARYRGRFPVEFDPTLERSDYLDKRRVDHEADCVEELRGIIRENTAELSAVEVTVLKARFALAKVQGLEGDAPKTLEQVGSLIGVTKERVRQIQNRALAKLREKLHDDFLAA